MRLGTLASSINSWLPKPSTEELLIAKRTVETILNIDRQKEQEKEKEKEEKKNFR